MSRTTPHEELLLIESIVSAHPNGVRISDIEAEMALLQADVLHRRTLQRRLQRLIALQRLRAVGQGVTMIYKPVTPTGWMAREPDAPAFSQAANAEPYIAMSPEGERIRDHVRRPLMYRQPVAYQRAFLDAYQPGHTFYLNESLRKQLHQMGRTSSNERPAGTYARDILNRLLVDLSWASSKLEGNTYSRLDTQNLIERGQVAKGKDAIETQMILNHKAAIEMLIEDAQEIAFDPFTFKNLHAVLSQDLMRDPLACGRLRWRVVDIAGTVYHPAALPQVIEDGFDLMLHKASDITDPFEQAFFLMVQLPYLQPFEDVNKRVSRIGANIPLIKHNLCPLSFVDVPERAYVEGTLGVYELNQIDLLRDVFVWAYERSCQRYLAITQTMVEPHPLKIKYREALIQAVQTVIKGLSQPKPALLAKVARQMAAPSDREAFAQMLSEALNQLHEGSIARYRLRRSEFQKWHQMCAGQTSLR